MIVYAINYLNYDLESNKYVGGIVLEFGVFRNREDALDLCKQKAEQRCKDLRQMGYGNMTITKQDSGYTILDMKGQLVTLFTIREVLFN